MTYKILLADDHALFREGLRSLMAAQPDFAVVAEASDGTSAHDAILVHRPDIAVIDIVLPGMQGVAVIEAIKRRLPQVRILVLTAHESEELLREALRVGVDGYLLKDTSFEELTLAMRSVAEGRKYLSPSISRHLVDTFLTLERGGRPGSSPLNLLTMRERSILQLIAEGRSNRGAAEVLSVSTKTVEKHRANVMRKLGLRNAGELMMVAVENGLIERPNTVVRLLPQRTG